MPRGLLSRHVRHLHSSVLREQDKLILAGLVSVVKHEVTWKRFVFCFPTLSWSLPPCSVNGCVTASVYLCSAGDALGLVDFRLTNFLSCLTSPPVCTCLWLTGWFTLPANLRKFCPRRGTIRQSRVPQWQRVLSSPVSSRLAVLQLLTLIATDGGVGIFWLQIQVESL